MITYKVWYLTGDTSSHDIQTLYRAKVDVSFHTDDHTIDVVVSPRREVRITTKSDEEEVWLKLCFGDKLAHFSTCYDI